MPILDELPDDYAVHIILFGKCSQEQRAWLEKRCERLYLLNQYTGSMVNFSEKLYIWLKFIFPWTGPISYSHYRSKETSEAIAGIIKSNAYDTIVWISAFYAEYLFRIYKNAIARKSKLIVDMVDSIYLHAYRNSHKQFGNILMYQYELWKIKKWEAKLINLSDASIYISDIDAKAIPSGLANTKKRFVVPNGLYTEDYTPEKLDFIRSPSIGFLGNMSYGPNINAVLWFYNNVFHQLKEHLPDLSLYIVGRNPDKSILDLSSDQNVHVTGTVDSIWPYVNSIDAFVIPLNKGAGLKNKILDIMSAGKPIVTSAIGNEGIYAASGKELFLCNDVDEYKDAIIKLFSEPETRKVIGSNAREFVNSHFAWPSIIRDYFKIVSG
jgi:glycosyltransferase involved in cell wall biosynthesis